MEHYRQTEIVSSEVREITPAMAREMLAHNDGNRGLSVSKVAFYTRIMRDGSWRLTHQGIAISDTGNVIDGQHRLAAVAGCGRPVRMQVTTLRAVDGRGELNAIGQPIDIGKARTISDITSEPRLNVTTVRTIVRDYVRGGQQRTDDPEIIAQGIELLRPSLNKLTEKCTTATKGLSRASIFAVMVLRDYQGIDEFQNYRYALLARSDLLPRKWVSWRERMLGMAAGTVSAPRGKDFRHFVTALTWQVTDPTKSDEQVLKIQKVDRYIDEVSAVAQEALMAALTKSVA